MVPCRRSMKIRTWPLLGLVLVASFLGHDLLMAAEAVAAPLLEGDTSRHGYGLHALSGDAPALQIHGSPSEHPENCRIGQPAVLRGGDAFEREHQDLVAPSDLVGAIVVISVHDEAFLWEEPHWPPGTLRAFFQVYRI